LKDFSCLSTLLLLEILQEKYRKSGRIPSGNHTTFAVNKKIQVNVFTKCLLLKAAVPSWNTAIVMYARGKIKEKIQNQLVRFSYRLILKKRFLLKPKQ